MKIYVFDIDGNLLSIPTKFYMQNIKTLKVESFYAGISGNIVSNKEKLGLRYYISEAYSTKNFRGKLGDKILRRDIKKSTVGPSWKDFVECVNSGSLFGVITGRGNGIGCLKAIFKDMILKNREGLDIKLFVEHIQQNKIFLKKEGEKNIKGYSEDKILEIFLDKYCFFYARSSKETIKYLNLKRKTSMPDAKLLALKDFESKIKELIKEVNIDESAKEIIDLGFSR